MKIYTDASTKQISGIAFVATDERNRVIVQNMKSTSSNNNNIAELQAILFALEETKDIQSKTTTIFTDSTYAINSITRAKHLEGDELKIVRDIQAHMSERKCKIFWIKGHCNDGTVLAYFNRQADILSKVARKNQELELQQQGLLLEAIKRKRYGRS